MTALLTKQLILCLDDEPPVLAALQRLLRHEPYEIVTADSPTEALKMLRERDVDLVIADQRMADMPGCDFLHRVQEICPSTARIMLTGYPDTPVILERIKEGVQRLITKPWRDDDLKKTIRRVLELRPRERRSSFVPARSPFVHRLEALPEIADVIFRLECAERTSAEVSVELMPLLGDPSLPSRGATFLFRGVRLLNESPLPFLRNLAETLLRLEIPSTIVEDSGCSDILLELLDRTEGLTVASRDRRLRILLAGEQEASLEVVRELLEVGGHACDAIGSTSEALPRIETRLYDVAVLDMDASEPDAVGIARHLRRHWTRAGVVGVSSRPDGWDPTIRESLGLRAFLRKPWRIADLLESLRQFPSLEKAS